MRYDTVFLDMGATLVEIVPSAEALMAQAIRDVTGRAVPMPDLQAAMNAVWGQVVTSEPMIWEHPSEEADRRWILEIDRRVLTQIGITEQIEAISSRSYDLFSHPNSYRVYDDVRPTLDALRARGYRLAIVSNWGWHLDRTCEGLGLARYFEGIFASARIGFEKPHPAIFHHALTALNTDPARTVHVGDSRYTDVGGARSVGLDAILLVRDGRTPSEDPGCPVIHTLLDLPVVLESHSEHATCAKSGVKRQS